MESIGIGLLGVGTVGTGVIRLLHEQAELIETRAGRRLRLRSAAVRDLAKPRSATLADLALFDDPRRVIDDPSVEIVVELIGGTDDALRHVLAALDGGKDVVTANKALLAEHGREVFDRARLRGRAVAFEASVGGGIPIVQALEVGLAANRVTSLAAIVNGTCNFILTRMTDDGQPYASALRDAQALGFAEADPSVDVDGTDTAHKLVILAQLAFGVTLTTREVPRSGIDGLQQADIVYAGELGYVVKLLALAKLGPDGLELRVGPTLVRKGTPLAEVRGPYNAVRVVGDAVGDTLFYGRGAGSLPTASAVVGDLIDVVVGRASLTFRARNHWLPGPTAPPIASRRVARSRYYLRFSVVDRPGAIAMLAHALGDRGISIASVIQHDPGDDAIDGVVPIVFMTHHATEADLQAAVATIDRLDVVRPPSVCLGVED